MYVGSSGEKKIWLRHLQLAITECLFEEDTSTDADIGAFLFCCFENIYHFSAFNTVFLNFLEKRQSSFTYKDGSVYSGTYLNSKVKRKNS